MHAIIICDQKIDYNVDKVYMIPTYIYMIHTYIYNLYTYTIYMTYPHSQHC